MAVARFVPPTAAVRHTVLEGDAARSLQALDFAVVDLMVIRFTLARWRTPLGHSYRDGIGTGSRPP